MVADKRRDAASGASPRYRRGRPGYHDPTAGIGGASPAQSALTLRLILAAFGFVVCTAFALWLIALDVPIGFPVALLAMAGIAIVDIAVIVRRKRRGEPG